MKYCASGREMKNKRILVTGSSGVIGRILTRKLREMNMDVLGVDKRSNSATDIVSDLSTEIHQCIYDFSPQIIFHLAAEFERTEETAGYEDVVFKHDVLASHNLLAATREFDNLERFVFASSYLVYAPSSAPLYEGSQLDPRNLVGAAKYFTENELRLLAKQYEFNYCNARISRVYGGGGREVISRWVRDALSGKQLQVFGENNFFNYIHAEDVADGLIELAENNACGTYNLVHSNSRPVAHVVEILQGIFPDLNVNHYSDAGGSTEYSKLVSEKMYIETGWKAKIGLEEGIEKTVSYELA